MSPDEKLAVQTVVMEYLQASTADHPTLLFDVLLSGDGHTLVHHVLSTQAAYAQRRADTLNHLLRAITIERPPVASQAPQEPPPVPGRVPMPGGL
jgi:hypothetical protein